MMSVRWLRLEGEVLYNDSKGGRRALCYGNYRKAVEVNGGGGEGEGRRGGWERRVIMGSSHR